MEEVERLYPRPDDFDMLLEKTRERWVEWLSQVAVIDFNSGKSPALTWSSSTLSSESLKMRVGGSRWRKG